MKRYVLHEPFNIYHFSSARWDHPLHNHTYFEIIFILAGTGVHEINGNRFEYRPGDVYLLGPEDSHVFDIATTTEFCYIRFNQAFTDIAFEEKSGDWGNLLRLLLDTPYQSKGSLVQDEKERLKLRSLLFVLQQEYENKNHLEFGEIRNSLMRTMLIILVRNASGQSSPKRLSRAAAIDAILLYIRKNIQNPRFLTVSHLARKFNIAPNYLSIFFKSQTGEPLKKYIIKYKIKLIESRLLYSRATLQTIADEFGFTDESHLCKQFQKYSGVSPAAFRKQA